MVRDLTRLLVLLVKVAGLSPPRGPGSPGLESWEALTSLLRLVLGLALVLPGGEKPQQ